MASDASREIRGFTRRVLLRNGLLVGLGTATVVTASVPLAASALADDVPASTDSPATAAPEQFKWGWCDLCAGMFYTGNSNYGHCPQQGDLYQHASVYDYNSDNYGFYYDAVTGGGWEGSWYWCRNCQGMFWGGRSAGACPYYSGNGKHNGTGSYPYVAYLGTNSAEGQGGWLWCKNCSGMFYGSGGKYNGVCPINGGESSRGGSYSQHDGTVSSNYYIGHSVAIPLGPPILVSPTHNSSQKL